MYESPITIINEQIERHYEDEIMTAVIKTGVHVDRDELIKAISYDRQQYEKGYSDGFENGLATARIQCFEQIKNLLLKGDES